MTRVGTLIAGKYRVDRVIGHGGMGVVVAATNLELREQVAIKFLHATNTDEPNAIHRFLREARMAVKLRSEHIARVLDIGKLEDGAPFMVMELLEGEELGAWVKKRGPVPIDQVLEVILQASEGIAEAHARGLVHRDIKPPNLFITQRTDGTLCVKVLDFGLVKLLGGNRGETYTGENELLGSPSYMSPEQILSAADIDARTDVWALGCVLFEALTGKRPFHAENMPEIVARVMHGEPTRLRALRPEAPAGLEAVILAMLVKDRAARMASVAEFAEALLPFVRKNQRAIVKRIRRILWRSSVPVLGTDDPDAEEEEEDSTTSTTVDVSPRHLTAAAPLPKIRAKPAREVAWLPTLTGGDVVPFIGGGGEEEPAASTSRAGTTTGRGRKHARSGVLRIALVPNRDRPVIDELSEVAGKSWNFRVCDDYESLLEALRTDAVDLAWLPPVVYVHAASVGLARLMLTLERKGLATYNSAIVVRNDSEARDISYVIGRRFAWVDQWSASGYLAPRQMLRSAGIDPDTAFRAQGFARSFPGVVTAITTDVADAGALHCSVDDQGDIVSSAWKPRDGLRAIAVSEAIPGDTICVPAMRPTEESQILAERLLELASSARVARAFLRVFGTNRLVAGNAERYASLKSAFGADLHARRGR